MKPLHQITEASFWTTPATCYQSILSQEDWLFANPYSSGLVATQYGPIERLARHPAMQAVNRANRGGGRARDGATSHMLSQHPNFQNEPEHAETRKTAIGILSGAGPRHLADLAGKIAAGHALALTEGGAPARCDLVQHYAARIAAETWSIFLTGTPEHAAFLAQNATAIAKLMAFATTPADIARADTGSAALMSWAAAQPLQGPPGLTAAMTFDAIDGAAGLTSNALWLLTTTPGLWQKLAANGGLIPPFMAEAARLVPNVLGLERCPVEDISLAGQTLPAGTNVLLLNAVGNRDPRVFRSPDHLDLHRNGPRDLSFGFGARSCAGRMLARLVAQSAVAALLDACASATLVEPVDWGPPGQLRAPRALRCEITPHPRKA